MKAPYIQRAVGYTQFKDRYPLINQEIPQKHLYSLGILKMLDQVIRLLKISRDNKTIQPLQWELKARQLK